MNTWRTVTLALLFGTTLALLPGCKICSPCNSDNPSAETSYQRPSPEPDRRFHIRYDTEVTALEPNRSVALWIPIPESDPHQQILNLKVQVPAGLEYKITRDLKFGNRMVYVHGPAQSQDLEVSIAYDVDRWEHRTQDHRSLDSKLPKENIEAAKEVFLMPSSLGVVNSDIKTRVAKLITNKNSTMEQARAFYDHVLEEMVYDKSGVGWGLGSTVYACEVGRGNCTDYHSMFISLCMAANIPARFQIGLYGKYETDTKGEYKTGGYHCWAEFYDAKLGWIPVDISEADQDPRLADYFFGNHTPNRVTISTGRDIVLSPQQQGAPRNYLLYPYAEVDGAEHGNIKKISYWTDLN